MSLTITIPGAVNVTTGAMAPAVLTIGVGIPGAAGPAGPGVPVGGTAGQYLQKTTTGVDYATDWVTLNLSAYAPLASPAFTGNPTAPTAALADNDTSLATTAFVQQELLSGTANAKNLEVYVRNQTGSTLAAGTIVYINGATGNRPTVTPAQANNDANSAQTFGFVKTSIANNGFGFVIVRGELENIDTSALTEGAQLYLSPTTAGTWTTTKPSAPQHLVYVGICVRAHPTQGVILVAVQNGYELNELHDVQITSPTNGQVLKYNSTTSLWYNGLDVGIPVGGTAGQFLQKIDGTDYNTDWVTVNLGAYAVKANNLSDLTSAPDARTNLGLGTMAVATASDYSTTTVANGLYYPLSSNPAAYLTASSLTPYLTKADNLGSLTNFATARDNLGLGTLNTPTFAGVTVQGSGANIANLTATSLSLTHATSGSFTIQPSVGITFPDASVQTTAFTGIPAGYITSVSSPLSVTSGNLSVDLSAYLTTSTAASTYQTLSGMSSYLTTSTAASTYFTIASAANKADLASPALTGTPTAPTAAAATNTTQIATTAFVTTADNLKANLASPTFTGTPTLPTGTIAVTQTAGNNTTAVATTAFVQAAVPAFATLTEARQFSNTTKVLSPSLAMWSMLSADIIYIQRNNFTVTNVGSVQYANLGSIATETRLAAAAASSSRARTYGPSQVDQSQSATVRTNISNFLNFSKPTYLAGRSATFDITDPVLTMAFYYGKAEADGVGNLTRRGMGWKVTGGTGSRFLTLQVHNGTTLTSVTSSFAVTGGQAFDWDIISDGAGNVTLYVNGSSVATSSAGPTGLHNVSPPVVWQEEYSTSAAPAITYHTAYNSRGRMAVINY